MEVFEGTQPKRSPKDTQINLETTICHSSASQKEQRSSKKQHFFNRLD